MSIKLTKKIISVLACCMLGVISTNGLSAYAAYTYRSSSGYVDDFESSCDNTGFSKIPSSGTSDDYYKYKAHIATSNSGYFFIWGFETLEMNPTVTGYGIAYLKLYLNDYNFNDYYAQYTIDLYGGGYTPIYMYIDQSTAPNGWSGTYYHTTSNNNPSFTQNVTRYCGDIVLTPVNNIFFNTGADGAGVVFKYN